MAVSVIERELSGGLDIHIGNLGQLESAFFLTQCLISVVDELISRYQPESFLPAEEDLAGFFEEVSLHASSHVESLISLHH